MHIVMLMLSTTMVGIFAAGFIAEIDERADRLKGAELRRQRCSPSLVQ